jgi:xanthine dehydrogenase accessory factor
MTFSAHAQTRFDDEMARLRAKGAAFAIATVVRTVAATSAKPGGKALLADDGTILEGWIGGGCARGAVSRAAREAIARCKPQFISLRPEELLTADGLTPGEERDGIRFVRNGCPSKGSMDIFIEPVLPLPRLIVLGTGPVAAALADLAGRFDFHRILCAPGADPATLPEVERYQDSFALAPEGTAGQYVVVATQGKGDEAALRVAVASGAAYVAFVGSRRKFTTLAGKLVADGIEHAALETVVAPAGLDIHAITAEEIALSILAQIIGKRRGEARNTEKANG